MLSPVPAHRCQSVSDFPARPERAAPIPGLQGKLRGSNLPGQQQNKTDDKMEMELSPARGGVPAQAPFLKCGQFDGQAPFSKEAATTGSFYSACGAGWRVCLGTRVVLMQASPSRVPPPGSQAPAQRSEPAPLCFPLHYFCDLG